MGFDITFLNEEYTEKGMLDKSIKFLSELVFKPNITKKRNGICFNEEPWLTSVSTALDLALGV